MSAQLPIPAELWEQIPPPAQAALLAVFATLHERLNQLEQQNQLLTRQVQELRDQLNQNSTNSSRPPSTDGPAFKRPPPKPRGQRPSGGQPGHPLQRRPLLPADQTHDLRPACCRRCGQALAGSDPQPLRHQVLELPPLRPHVTEYRLHRLHCPCCSTSTCAALPAHVAGCQGPRLQATTALLTGAYRLSKREAAQLLEDVLGVPVAAGTVCDLERQTTQALEPVVAEATEHVRGQPANVDETSWREARDKAWLWVAVGAYLTVYQVHATRGRQSLEALLGDDYPFVLTSDRWSAYNGMSLAQRQLCWAHLRRDFQAMIDRGQQELGRGLLEVSDALFDCWHRVRDGTLSRKALQARIPVWRVNLRILLERGQECGCAKTAGTCRELLAVEAALWTFAYKRGVEPTNNAAERALRHAVRWRKTSYGTASAAGSRFVESILTVVESCRQQGRNVLAFLTSCCEAWRNQTAAPSLVPELNG
jgi:transposase